MADLAPTHGNRSSAMAASNSSRPLSTVSSLTSMDGSSPIGAGTIAAGHGSVVPIDRYFQEHGQSRPPRNPGCRSQDTVNCIKLDPRPRAGGAGHGLRVAGYSPAPGGSPYR